MWKWGRWASAGKKIVESRKLRKSNMREMVGWRACFFWRASFSICFAWLVRVWTHDCCSSYVRGALLAKGPDSSFGEVHRGSCSGNIHMEEEVEWEIKRMKWKMGETNEECEREGRREIKHTGAWDMDDMTRTNTWANVVWDIIMSADKHLKKVTCEV